MIGPRVGVVVPVHDEAALLPACLAALLVAAERAPVPVDIVVVLDACTDRSALIAAAAGVRVVDVVARNVGVARAVGFAALLDGTAAPATAPAAGAAAGATGVAGVAGVAAGAAGVWLATTDADSRVPPDWLTRQLGYAAGGADAVAGTVAVVDWAGHPPRARTAFGRAYRPAPDHRHVHGANLGLSAAAYLAAGGIAPLPLGEDVDLVDRLVAAGRTVAWAADLPVVTSARRRPRASGGFGDYLRTLSA